MIAMTIPINNIPTISSNARLTLSPYHGAFSTCDLKDKPSIKYTISFYFFKL